MQKIPKIYFIASFANFVLPLLMVVSFMGRIADVLKKIVKPSSLLQIYANIFFLLVVVTPLLFLSGLYLSFFLFRNEPVRKTYVRWGIWLNFLILLGLLVSFVMPYL